MTLGTLILGVGVVAALLTALMHAMRNRAWVSTYESLPLSYLQHFVAVLFLFSGAVKAVDPLGTAYKMEQYFAEFEQTFSQTWLAFMSDLFPLLSEYAIGFSVVMIIFEIVLGIMVLLGTSRRFTAWAFLLLILFFTFLTGFTYLTGYVPQGVNFFDFSNWGSYVETNMKVTDCGCFGDFLKLAPFVSFMKDVFLLIPAVLFLVFNGKMHQLFTTRTRQVANVASTVLLLGFCYYNYGVTLPVTDFRPFKIGEDVRTQKNAEMEAANNVQVTAFRLTNTQTNKVVEIPFDSYLADIENYPEAEGWDRSTLEQVKTEPTVKRTKISDFSIQGKTTTTYTYVDLVTPDGDTITDFDASMIADLGDTTGYQVFNPREETDSYEGDIEEELLADPNYSFMIVCHKLEKAKKKAFINKVNALQAGAAADGFNFYVVSGSTDAVVEEFKAEAQANYTFHSADDILLKTIVRSNPGIVLWKDGVIVHKWHHKQVPTYEQIKAKYMQ